MRKLCALLVLGLAAGAISPAPAQAGPLSLGRLTLPERLSPGQTALAAIAVGNGGRSSILLTAAHLDFVGPGVSATVRTALPRPLSAASTTVLTFTVAVGEWIFQKKLNASVRLTGIDLVSTRPVEARANWTAAATLQTKPDLVIAGLEARPLAVTRGQPFNSVVRILNRGEAAATVLAVTPRFDSSDVSTEKLTTHSRIPGNGGQHEFVVTGRIGGSVAAARLVSATVQAHDDNSGRPAPLRANLAIPVTLLIRPRPTLEVLAVDTSRERVRAGERLKVDVTVRIVSQEPVDVATAELVFFPRLVEARLTTPLRSLSPSSPTTTLVFEVKAGLQPGKVRFTGVNLIASERSTGQPLGGVVNRSPRQPEVTIE